MERGISSLWKNEDELERSVKELIEKKKRLKERWVRFNYKRLWGSRTSDLHYNKLIRKSAKHDPTVNNIFFDLQL